jgi:LAO/AO transport system kinase
MDLDAAALGGDRLALARLLSRVEDNAPDGLAALERLFPHTGQAHLIGITGASGTGKSSLVNQLARFYRTLPNRKAPIEKQNPGDGGGSEESDPKSPMVWSLEGGPRRVGVVAVDPTSPFTGGAILGDRVRMRDLSGDPGVFIRSMATRGSLGGLAAATSRLVQVLDAVGFEVILIETVGAGQAEVEIAHLAHTTLVVEAPGLGDDIQAIKAGILEIADILVVNKADRPGVEATERALRSVLQLGFTAGERPIWEPPILKTVATEGTGVPELANAIARHREHLIRSGELARRERARLKNELDHLLQDLLVRRWQESLPRQAYEGALERVAAREASPWQVVRELVGVQL